MPCRSRRAHRGFLRWVSRRPSCRRALHFPRFQPRCQVLGAFLSWCGAGPEQLVALVVFCFVFILKELLRSRSYQRLCLERGGAEWALHFGSDINCVPRSQSNRGNLLTLSKVCITGRERWMVVRCLRPCPVILTPVNQFLRSCRHRGSFLHCPVFIPRSDGWQIKLSHFRTYEFPHTPA